MNEVNGLYLKALSIQGFKSFADKTTLTFEKDITAIVGPNGSGKSNISDAILWVMGEQRTKALRGGKMEDIIFGGTAIRSPMGFAEVTLVIDNSGHIFDSDSPEVELTRRYYRSGESEYYINREQVRLKDINTLLMNTGLGRDGYSIIGQGKISDIISSKSTDRREIFDEAAGISKFRYSKEEAEHRLEKTEENLLRINDKIEELELQVGPLKDQSEKAKKYLVLRDELRIKEISVWMTTLDSIKEKSKQIAQEYEEDNTLLEKAKAALEGLYVSTESLSDRMHTRDEEIEEARGELSSRESKASECESGIAVLRENIRSNDASLERLLADIASQEERSDEIRQSIEENNARLDEIAKALAGIEKEITANNNSMQGCRMKISSRETNLKSLEDRYSQIRSEADSVDSRVRILTEMQKDYEGFSKAVKTVMRESSRGNLRGIHGPVANLVSSDRECALAIETALGGAGQNIVTDTRNDGRSAIEMLKRSDSGRATFLPLDTIRGTVMRDVPSDDPGFVGVAYDLVSFDNKYEQIIASILGKTVVVESLSDAVRISKNNNDRFRIVTLDGQMVSVGGAMTGGSSAKGTGAISRANELKSLAVKQQQLNEKKKSLEANIDKAKSELSGLRYNLEMAMEDRTEITSRQSSYNAEATAKRAATEQLTLLLNAISGDSDIKSEAIEKTEKENKALNEKIGAEQTRLEEIKTSIAEIKAKIDELSGSRMELEGKRSKIDREAQELNSQIIDYTARTARIEQRRITAGMEEKQIVDKLWDSYELSYSAAQEQRQTVDNLQKANREAAELRRSISALGSPNIGAIEEYERVKERYDFLTSQRDDIDKAKKELLGIIKDITGEMTTVFSEQFGLIRQAFTETFLELFGGGKADLVLDDEEHILDSGIEIKVQPPGKALTTISLMSGGEMAFVAIALYFAILKVRPAPFCVMDEIEAALDESNVERYAQYMRRMSNKTQFIVITHRRGTMEEADVLYGVTMQEKGVSKVIGLEIDEARKSAEG